MFAWTDFLDLLDDIGLVPFSRHGMPPAAPFSFTKKKMGEKKSLAQAISRGVEILRFAQEDRVHPDISDLNWYYLTRRFL